MIPSKFILSILVLLVLLSCLPTKSRYLTTEEMGIRPSDFSETPRGTNRRTSCQQQDNYRIDTSRMAEYPMRYLRINFHWMNSEDSSQNVPEADIRKHSANILHAMNYALKNNKKSWLPFGSDIPIHPINFQYVLTGRPDAPEDDGIYYHYDDSLYYYVHFRKKHSNLYSRDVFNKYGIQMDTVLNIFFMPHQPDSVASPTYAAGDVGVALRNAVKVASNWVTDYEKDPDNYWRYRGFINHEVGHILGLSHAWIPNDGCDDTPKHKNKCYSRSQGNGCDTLCSNNVMDYNSLQLAWTPDQIARVHRRLNDTRYLQRNFLRPDWCTLDIDKSITIRDTTDWNTPKDVHGNLIIANGAQLTIGCKTSMPAGSTITIEPEGTLIVDGGMIHQYCDLQWQGIVVQSRGKQQGQLLLLNDGKIEDVVATD